jgi:hypothetical protein
MKIPTFGLVFLSIVITMDQAKITFGRGYFLKYKSLADGGLNHALEIGH